MIIEISDIQTAPQFPNIAIGQQYELLDWLKHVTFPAEERLADTDFATVLYKEVVRRVLAFGVSVSTCPSERY
jgi:guanine deaminase